MLRWSDRPGERCHCDHGNAEWDRCARRDRHNLPLRVRHEHQLWLDHRIGDPTGFSSQPTSAHIEGLTPGTTYYYRLDATTADLATTGSDGTFTTPPLPLALRLQETLAAAPKRSGRGKFSANFTVTNTDSTYNATGVRVTEVVPADAAADLAISDPSCAIDDEGRVSCTVGTLAPGVSATVTIGLEVTKGSRLTSVGVAIADQPTSEVATALATVEHPLHAFHG